LVELMSRILHISRRWRGTQDLQLVGLDDLPEGRPGLRARIAAAMP
jgi:hypothetical protein